MGCFRLADDNDAPRVLELMARFYAEDGYAFNPQEAPSVLSRLLHDPRLGRLWVAVDDGRIVGYLLLTIGYSLEYLGPDGLIDELYFEEDARGRGLGTEALAMVEAECRRLGIRVLHLEVERENPGAQRLYRRKGFVDRNRLLLTKVLEVEPS